MTESIKLPKEWYIGIKEREEFHDNEKIISQLGFMTPEGTDTAAKNRKGTVDNWLGVGSSRRIFDDKKKEYYYANAKPREEFNIKTLQGELLDGYKIAKSIRRVYWGGGNVVWRIEDPRGFELEISSSNLARILDCTSIVEGEIQGKCIWGRMGKDNVLLPENSQPYQDAVVTTERISKKVSTKDVKIGDTVMLHDGQELIYMGLMRMVLAPSIESNIGSNKYSWTTIKKGHIFKNIPKEDDVLNYKVISTPKISSVNKLRGIITPEQAESEINEMIRSGEGLSHNFNVNYNSNISFVSCKNLKVDDYELELQTIDINDFLHPLYHNLCHESYGEPEAKCKCEDKFIIDTDADLYYCEPQYSYSNCYSKEEKLKKAKGSMGIEERAIKLSSYHFGKKEFTYNVPPRGIYHGNRNKDNQYTEIERSCVKWFKLRLKYKGNFYKT